MMDEHNAIGRDFRYESLRSLRPEDAAPMLEWMHDPDIAGRFQADFMSLQEEDALGFIKGSWIDGRSLHFAISDDGDDAYLGTVSLKNIDTQNASAEYAIGTQRRAHGTGAALSATRSVLRYAFGNLGLHRVYLNVRADNPRAIRFYEKVGFRREGIARDALKPGGGAGFIDLVWFAILESDCL